MGSNYIIADKKTDDTNMIRIKKIVFDVLKPHRPTGLEFASAVAEKCPGSVPLR